MHRHHLRKGLAGIAALAAAGLLATGCSNPADGAAAPESGGDPALTVTDVAGRTVSFDERPDRVILGEGRAALVTAFLDKDNPLEHVVALGGDLHTAAPSFEEKLFEVDPAAKDLPVIGHIGKGDVTVENLLAQDPDVIVLTLDQKKAAEENGFLGKLDQAGLKYVFTDFRQKPLEHTTASVTVLGQILDEEETAGRFNEFYDAKVADIEQRVKDVEDKPKTFLWRAAGLMDCCGTVKDSNLGDLVNAAGGDNLGDHLLDGDSGSLTPEKVLAEDPPVIIATGGAWAPDKDKPAQVPHVELGYQADPAVAEKTLDGVLATPGFDQLQAPKDGQLHAIYHQFYDSPYNVFALEQIGAWLHPDKFADVDPAADFAEFHEEWMPFDLTGTFFTTVGTAK